MTVDGIVHFPNLPTEEVFTTPDPLRVDGHVSATMPLELYGTIIRGLRVEFAGGRVTGIDADENAETLRTAVAKDEGAGRLGELALVDGSGGSGRCRRSSSTRSSTRTLRATSRSATASPTRWPTRPSGNA